MLLSAMDKQARYRKKLKNKCPEKLLKQRRKDKERHAALRKRKRERMRKS